MDKPKIWNCNAPNFAYDRIKHEHCRKDRDEYVDVYISNSWYEIEEDSKELTAFDPFSILFFGEDKKNMKRASNTGIFKLK